jgi:2-polyprenyl-3-methyl-5-hydroxy-6-metoxy-1,4-benzoquinol methylase
MKCRHCSAEVSLVLIDLGSAPPSNAYLTKLTMRRPEKWFPLKVLVCESCWLVQAEAYSRASELFNDEYAYFSSFSELWLQHSQNYVATMTERFVLTAASHVVEIAANDGYLLQYVQQRGIPCLGIEPTASTAAAARGKGITIIEDFFGISMAKDLVSQGKSADLVVANNVLAHVPDLKDFANGIALLLKPHGVATFEFPHLMQMIAEKEFDTIYHEHFSYLSLTAVSHVFELNGLSIFDVEELPTHGGSLRVYAQRSDSLSYPVSSNVKELMDMESTTGMKTKEYYAGFQEKADQVKNDFVSFLIEAKRAGKSVIAYGAAAKGNTLINYAGIRPDLIPCVVDRNPAKQGKFMPGSRIPIVDESCIMAEKPDYVVIIPWNIRDEVMTQLTYIREWGGQFVTAVPALTIV